MYQSWINIAVKIRQTNNRVEVTASYKKKYRVGDYGV
jgi:hypothetical protein